MHTNFLVQACSDCVYLVTGTNLVQINAEKRTCKDILEIKNIRVGAASDKWLVMVDDKKNLFRYEIGIQGELKAKNSILLPKAATSISILNDIAIIADKFGDVHKLDLTKEYEKSDNGLELLMGHVSTILDMVKNV